MHTPINTRTDYIEIGTSVSGTTLQNALLIPAPISVPASDEFSAEANRNANNVMTIQEVGRTQYTTSVRFGKLANTKWWEINRWFRTHGYVFYMKYFSHTDGCVKIHKFYRGNIEKATPSAEQEIRNGYSVPKYYTGCGFNIIDMGDDDITIVQEITI